MNENILKLEAPSGAKECQSQETTLKLMSGHVVLGAVAFKVPFLNLFVCLFILIRPLSRISWEDN